VLHDAKKPRTAAAARGTESIYVRGTVELQKRETEEIQAR
jgi:hypothetical protein